MSTLYSYCNKLLYVHIVSSFPKFSNTVEWYPKLNVSALKWKSGSMKFVLNSESATFSAVYVGWCQERHLRESVTGGGEWDVSFCADARNFPIRMRVVLS